MCDFSLQHAKARDAQVADKLEVRDFGRGTYGFASADETDKCFHNLTAVCVRPGTEIVFDEMVRLKPCAYYTLTAPKQRTARFRQINKDEPSTHHDALEFADGEFILLTLLAERQHATVLQLPAAPKTAEEEIEQTRLPVTA